MEFLFYWFMRKLFYLLLGLLVIAGCSSRQNEYSDVETISIQVSDTTSNMSAFERFDFVKLEVTSESLLPDIAKVVTTDDRIYVLSMMDARIFIFSNSGKFINNLKRGQGPGEVIFVSDMDVVGDNLFVLDNYRNVHKYDLDGNYIEDVFSSEEPYFSFKYSDSGIMLFDPYINRKSSHMIRLVKDGSKTDVLPKEETLKDANFIHYNFFNGDYISWPLCDTIYQTKDASITPRYAVRFDEKNFFDMKKSQTFTFDEICEMNQDKTLCRWICDVAPYEGGLYFAYRYGKPYYVKYEEGIVNVYTKLAEELPESINASVGNQGSEMIYACRADDLIAYKEEMLSENKELNHDVYKSLGSDDNPVLLFFDLDR